MVVFRPVETPADSPTGGKALGPGPPDLCCENARTQLFLVVGWYVVVGEVNLPVPNQDDSGCIALC